MVQHNMMMFTNINQDSDQHVDDDDTQDQCYTCYLTIRPLIGLIEIDFS